MNNEIKKDLILFVCKIRLIYIGVINSYLIIINIFIILIMTGLKISRIENIAVTKVYLNFKLYKYSFI